MKKAGAWYRVLNYAALPEHATEQIAEFGEDQKGVKVKFIKATSRKSAKKLLERRTRE